MTDQIKSRIDALFRAWDNGVCPGGQVAVRLRGETVYERCFGYADIENMVPVTPASVFHVASVSKQFTVMAAMLLREDGALDLDADVRAYIPDLIRFDEPVTVRNLMNNDSGIRDMWELLIMSGVRIDDTITQRDALAMVSAQTALNFPPESQFLYSNSNFLLLAEIIERLSGQSLGTFLKARIFAPLGMADTVVREQYWQRIDRRARSFEDNGTEFFHSVLNFGCCGPTSLHTSARDLLKWMENYRHPTICTPGTVAEMRKVPTLSGGTQADYAAGLRCGLFEGRRCFRHGGVDASFRAFVLGFPDDGLDIVILANTQNVETEPAAFAIARIVLGLPAAEVPAPAARAAFDEREAPGYYYADLPAAAAAEILSENGALMLRTPFGGAPLTRERGNLYRVGRLDTRLLLGGERPALILRSGVTPLCKADAAPLPAERLRCWEGRYESAELHTAYRVAARGGALWLSHFRLGDARMYPLGGDRFVAAYDEPLFVEFLRGSGGAVIGLRFSASRVYRLPLSRTGD